MREKMQQMMIGRYGLDELARFLNVLILVLAIVGLFVRPLIYLTFPIFIVQYARVFSRNIYKRSAENQTYLRLRYQAVGWLGAQKQRLAQRHVYRFYRCPGCKQQLRVPRGKGKLSITCPNCRNEFVKRT